MHVTTTWWVATLACLAVLLGFDLFGGRAGPASPRRSAVWVIVYALAAVAFAAIVAIGFGFDFGGQFLAAWVTEYSLSIDNLFVFLVLMTRFRVPEQFQLRVLTVGVVLALVFRAVLIAVGVYALNRFSWLFFIFGAFLFWTAFGLVRPGSAAGQTVPDGEPAPAGVPLRAPAGIRWLTRHLPTTSDWDHGHPVIRKRGRLVATPMLLTIVAIGTADVFFALDSIPAIFGLTREPFLVITANAFALVGLRRLFFVVRQLLDRLPHLDTGLALVLAFIGVKLVLEALHDNTLAFLNDGEPLRVPQVPTLLSLAVVVGILLVTTGTSLLSDRAFGSDRR